MSVFYGVRLSDESSAKIAATGRGKSAVIQAAVDSYFNLDVVGTSGGKDSTETIQPAMKPKKIEKPAAKARKARLIIPRGSANPTIVGPSTEAVGSGVAVPVAVPSSGCAKHPGVGWSKGGGWWCPSCGKVV